MLDFSRQFADLRDELMTAIGQVCLGQRFILGPQVASFERAAATACAAPHAIGCASGTDALWLALAAANIGTSHLCPTPEAVPHASLCQREEWVVTTPFSFFASASAILRAGARPLFADIDPLTFNLSSESVRELLASPSCPPVKAILPVHLYGQCADWDGFESIAQDYPGILLFEDAAQAFGAGWTSPDGSTRPAGSLGVAAAFSFYPTKNLSAMGDAGLMTTRSSEVAGHAHSLRAHGMTRRYFHDEVGWNSRMDSLQAAVLEVKLRYLPAWNQRRRDLAARYNELFLDAGIGCTSTTVDGVVLPYVHPRAQHVFHQYVIRAPRRDQLRAHLTALGIGSEVYYPLCLHQQQALLPLGYKMGDFPQAERAAAEVLALPMYPELRDDEQETVVDAIRAFFA
jgi:dTDP-4-amino-4,6-dideoxygalactose transaminase